MTKPQVVVCGRLEIIFHLLFTSSSGTPSAVTTFVMECDPLVSPPSVLKHKKDEWLGKRMHAVLERIIYRSHRQYQDKWASQLYNSVPCPASYAHTVPDL